MSRFLSDSIAATCLSLRPSSEAGKYEALEFRRRQAALGYPSLLLDQRKHTGCSLCDGGVFSVRMETEFASVSRTPGEARTPCGTMQRDFPILGSIARAHAPHSLLQRPSTLLPVCRVLYFGVIVYTVEVAREAALVGTVVDCGRSTKKSQKSVR